MYFETSTREREVAPADWVPFLTSDDIADEGCSIDLDARRRVAPAFAAEYENGLLRANELLVKVKGPNQTTAYNEAAPDRRVLVSGTIWGALVQNDIVDPHYLVAVLSSEYAAIARSRLRTNLNVEFLSPDDLVTIPLPVPESDAAQAYISDKVRQAERLRARARSLEAAFRTAIEERYPAIFGPIQLRGRTNRASVAELDGDLSPGAFNPERVRIRRYLRENGGRRLDSLAVITTPTTNSYRLQDAYLGLDGISSASSMLTLSTVADDEVGGTVRVLPEGPAISKLRPYLNKACYVPAEMAGTFGSTELLCIRPNKGISGWFLYGVLKLESSVRQLNPVSTGSTHPRIDRADVMELMIPWHEEHEELGAELARSQQVYFCASRLTAAAKLLVEALIDNHVSEAELQTAHADRSEDRALLGRLTAKGLGVAGEPPLFPDLDQLEQALAETATN